MSEIEAKGVNGQVLFDGQFVTITRKGGLGRLTVGKGEKRIPISSISAVQWKEPGAMVNGFIQFTVGGGNENRSKFGSQTMDAAKDENSVVIAKKHAAEMKAVRECVEQAIVARQNPNGHVSAPTKVEQLKQLAELRDSGVLSDDEFAAEKAKLLSEP